MLDVTGFFRTVNRGSGTVTGTVVAPTKDRLMSAGHLRLLPWQIPGNRFETGGFPLLMGILNTTPDSFSDGGEHETCDNAVRHGIQLMDDGADLIDVGGESTRPGSTPVSLETELLRTIPVIERLSEAVSCPISIDTTKAEVAWRAIDAGASIINDISGLRFDSAMLQVASDLEAGVICMHLQGTPQTMQNDPHYDDVVREVTDWLGNRVDELESAGISRDRIVIDPGIGFGKSAEHNVALLSSVNQLRSLARPVLIGHSRKRFLSTVTGRTVDDRSAGTIGVSLSIAVQGVDIIRVHDVRSVRDALLAWQTIQNHSFEDGSGPCLMAIPNVK